MHWSYPYFFLETFGQRNAQATTRISRRPCFFKGMYKKFATERRREAEEYLKNTQNHNDYSLYHNCRTKKFQKLCIGRFLLSFGHDDTECKSEFRNRNILIKKADL